MNVRRLGDVRVEVASVAIFLGAAALGLWRLVNATLAGDLFEHAAAVRELATHPASPLNPLLAIDAPHTLFSPYSLVVALLVRATGADAFSALAFAGLINAVLLAVGLVAFIRVFSPSRPASILAVVFAVCAWGSSSLPFGADPWIWSGFLNLNSLTYGLGYPSALAMGLGFGLIAAVNRALAAPRWWLLPVIGGGQAIILVTHPYTALFVVVATATLMVRDFGRSSLPACLAIVTSLVGGTLVALAWPYYPVTTLLTGQVGAFDLEQREMYSTVLGRLGPALLGLPALALRFRRDHRDALVRLFAALSAIYLAGYATHRYTLGRELPFIAICLQIALAIAVAEGLRRWRAVGEGAVRTSFARMVGVVAAILVGLLVVGSIRSVLSTGESHADVEAVARLTQQYDVVMAEGLANYQVPAWGGKVVDWAGSLAFVPDLQERHAARAAFFDPATSDATRRAIANRYGVRWILYDLRSETLDRAVLPQLDRIGRRAATSDDGQVILLATQL